MPALTEVLPFFTCRQRFPVAAVWMRKAPSRVGWGVNIQSCEATPLQGLTWTVLELAAALASTHLVGSLFIWISQFEPCAVMRNCEVESIDVPAASVRYPDSASRTLAGAPSGVRP